MEGHNAHTPPPMRSINNCDLARHNIADHCLFGMQRIIRNSITGLRAYKMPRNWSTLPRNHSSMKQTALICIMVCIPNASSTQLKNPGHRVIRWAMLHHAVSRFLVSVRLVGLLHLVNIITHDDPHVLDGQEVRSVKRQHTLKSLEAGTAPLLSPDRTVNQSISRAGKWRLASSAAVGPLSWRHFSLVSLHRRRRRFLLHRRFIFTIRCGLTAVTTCSFHRHSSSYFRQRF